MSKVQVKKVPSADDRSLPVFSEFEDLMDRVRDRAYSLFRNRGFSNGNDLDDWLMAEREVCMPPAELEEDEDEYEFKVALAGYEPEEISVTASPRELIVKATRESRSKADGKRNLRWSEFHKDEVYRRVVLPGEVDIENIQVKFKNGLLEIDAPKAKAKVRETKVSASS